MNTTKYRIEFKLREGIDWVILSRLNDLETIKDVFDSILNSHDDTEITRDGYTAKSTRGSEWRLVDKEGRLVE